eukprot:TCONS_00007801-protein
MEDQKDFVEEVLKQMSHSYVHLEMKKSLQNEINKANLYSGDIKKHLKKFLKESGYSVTIQNFIYQRVLEKYNKRYNSSGAYKEPLEYIEKAQITWQKCIVKSINNMCSELSLPLSRKRNAQDQKVLSQKLENMQLGLEYNDEAYSKLRPVYSSADFFEVLVNIKNPNLVPSTEGNIEQWGLMQAGLIGSNDIKSELELLNGKTPQVGIDDVLNASFASEWIAVGQKVIAQRHIAASRQYLKQGCPSGLRKDIWRTFFNIDITNESIHYYERLKGKVLEYDMLVDYLIMKDVRLTATNDDAFFVFEDVLHQVMLVFSRDTWMIDQFHHFSNQPPKSYVRGRLGLEEYSVNYPPCGIFPFHGFSMLAAPLCYIFEKPVELFFVFRQLYSRYFYQLYDISSHPESIVSLCSFFEERLQLDEPQVFKHLLEIKAQPLRIVFSWFLFAFSGYLATDQTLQLWERVLGFDSLRLLAVLAVAIISYRRENLLGVTTKASAEAVLADISTIKVIPVLVQYLSNS